MKAIIITQTVNEAIELHRHIGDAKFEQSFTRMYPQDPKRYNALWYWWFDKRDGSIAGQSGTGAIDTAIRLNPATLLYTVNDFINKEKKVTLNQSTMKKNYEKYTESVKIWEKWRKRIEEETGTDPIYGYCNWEHDFGNFKLECWNVQDRGAVIFQFWPDGNGFHEYQSVSNDAPSKLIDAAPKLLKALKSITMSVKAHPDCEEHSEFADMVETAEEAIKKAQ